VQMLWRAQKSAVHWRIRHLSTTLKGAEAHTVLVQEIPGIAYGLPAGVRTHQADMCLAVSKPGNVV
jgi:hypothetical protein